MQVFFINGKRTFLCIIAGSNVTVTDIEERLATAFEQARDNLKVFPQQRCIDSLPNNSSKRNKVCSDGSLDAK